MTQKGYEQCSQGTVHQNPGTRTAQKFECTYNRFMITDYTTSRTDVTNRYSYRRKKGTRGKQSVSTRLRGAMDRDEGTFDLSHISDDVIAKVSAGIT